MNFVCTKLSVTNLYPSQVLDVSRQPLVAGCISAEVVSAIDTMTENGVGDPGASPSITAHYGACRIFNGESSRLIR